MNSTRFDKNIFNDPKCPLENSWFLSKVKTPAKSHAHISRPFWIFELNHIVFEFGHLNAIYQYLREGQLDREDRVSFVTPLSSYLMLESPDKILVLVGVSCHSPRICLPLVALKHPCIMFIFSIKVEMGIVETLASKEFN